jgi:hypothetical protein
LTDAESLNLVHPLVRAAIAHAQAWAGDGSVKLHLPAGASPELLALTGKSRCRALSTRRESWVRAREDWRQPAVR